MSAQPAALDALAAMDALLAGKSWDMREEEETEAPRPRFRRGGRLRNWRDEWEPSKWVYVDAVMKRCRLAVTPGATRRSRSQAIGWLFAGQPAHNIPHVSFAACCAELHVRPYVLQAMTQHWWYRNHVMLPVALPSAADPVHPAILSEAAAYAALAGEKAVTAVWRHPSIPLQSVVAKVAEAAGCPASEARAATDRLVDAGMLAPAQGRLWFTGRPPDFFRHRRSSFARSWLDPQDPLEPVLTPEEQTILFGENNDNH